MGLRAELLYPNGPIGQVLSNIAARCSLYAIRVLPFNETQHTINVFVIHSGDPNEHRNIPVDDALEMIANDYEAIPPHVRRNAGGGGGGVGGPAMPTAVQITPTSSAAAPPLNQRHPDAVQALVNLIADNRPVTVLQYDRVIQYLRVSVWSVHVSINNCLVLTPLQVDLIRWSCCCIYFGSTKMSN